MIKWDRMPNEMPPYQRKLTVVIASVTLFLGMIFLLPVEQSSAETAIFGNMEKFIPVLSGFLAFLGTRWVFADSSSPRRFTEEQRLVHFILPTFSVYVLTQALIQMQRNATWWYVYLAGTLLFFAVVNSEYQDLYDVQRQHALPGILLVALSHALFFILAVVFKIGLLRFVFVVPGIFFAVIFISLRMFKLRTGQIQPGAVILIALLLTQLAGALYYFFITPIQYALILTALLYSFISIFSGIVEKRKGRSLFLEALFLILLVSLILILTSLSV